MITSLTGSLMPDHLKKLLLVDTTIKHHHQVLSTNHCHTDICAGNSLHKITESFGIFLTPFHGESKEDPSD
jgi:hypothetical protein